MQRDVLFGGEVVVVLRREVHAEREVFSGGEVVVVLGREVHVEREVLLTESKVVWSAEGMFLGSFVGKVVAG